jgi:hypothetical protein
MDSERARARVLGHGEEELTRPTYKRGSGSKHVKCRRNERYEPRKRTEPHEAIEVPRRVVRERAALPSEFVRPSTEFFAPILVRRFWRN